MISALFDYVRILFFKFFFAVPGIHNNKAKYPTLFILCYILWDVWNRRHPVARRESHLHPATMADKQMVLAHPTGEEMAQKQLANVMQSDNVEIEQEVNEETTLSETKKNTADTKSHEKSAVFEAEANTSIVAENESRNVQSAVHAAQSSSESVTKTGQVTTTKITSSHSFSMEESEEYEYEG